MTNEKGRRGRESQVTPSSVVREARNTQSLSELLHGLKETPEVIGLATVDPAAIEIGLALRRARVKKGTTQSELARATGIPQSAISGIERGLGRDGPSYRTLRTIADALDVELALRDAGTSEDPAKARAEFARLMNFVAPSTTPDFLGVSQSPGLCMPLIKSVLSDIAYAKAAKILLEIAARRGAHYEPSCGIWKLRPHGHVRFNPRAPVLAIAYHGTGNVAVHGDSNDFEQMAIAVDDQMIDVRNEGPETLSLMTMVITPDIVECL